MGGFCLSPNSAVGSDNVVSSKFWLNFFLLCAFICLCLHVIIVLHRIFVSCFSPVCSLVSEGRPAFAFDVLLRLTATTEVTNAVRSSEQAAEMLEFLTRALQAFKRLQMLSSLIVRHHAMLPFLQQRSSINSAGPK